jgi:hypothetical protein
VNASAAHWLSHSTRQQLGSTWQTSSQQLRLLHPGFPLATLHGPAVGPQLRVEFGRHSPVGWLQNSLSRQSASLLHSSSLGTHAFVVSLHSSKKLSQGGVPAAQCVFTHCSTPLQNCPSVHSLFTAHDVGGMGVGDGLLEGVGDGLPVGVGVALPEGVGDGELLGEAEGRGVGVRPGVGVGPPLPPVGVVTPHPQRANAADIDTAAVNINAIDNRRTEFMNPALSKPPMRPLRHYIRHRMSLHACPMRGGGGYWRSGRPARAGHGFIGKSRRESRMFFGGVFQAVILLFLLFGGVFSAALGVAGGSAR